MSAPSVLITRVRQTTGSREWFVDLIADGEKHASVKVTWSRLKSRFHVADDRLAEPQHQQLRQMMMLFWEGDA